MAGILSPHTPHVNGVIGADIFLSFTNPEEDCILMGFEESKPWQKGPRKRRGLKRSAKRNFAADVSSNVKIRLSLVDVAIRNACSTRRCVDSKRLRNGWFSDRLNDQKK